MSRVALPWVASLLLLAAAPTVARAQPMPPMPGPAAYAPMPPPPPRVYAPRPYYVPPPNEYRPVYVQPTYGAYPMYDPYWRKAWVLRAVGIPLLSVGIPAAVAGGIVWIVGGACQNCSSNVTYTGIGLFAAGLALTIPGAILLGVASYYRWMSAFASRANIGVALAPGGGAATMSVRF